MVLSLQCTPYIPIYIILTFLGFLVFGKLRSGSRQSELSIECRVGHTEVES
jgi:hypothetical protein